MATVVLLEQLAAWRSVLRDLLPLRLDEEDEGNGGAYEDQDGEISPLVLRVHGGRLTRDMSDVTLRTASEALSALTMLARVNVVAWRAEVGAVWPEFDHEQVIAARYKRWREIVMGLHFEVAECEAIEPLKARVILQDSFSGEFRRLLVQVKAYDEAAIGSVVTSRRWTHPMVPIALTLVQRDSSPPQGDRAYWIERERSAENDKILIEMVSIANVQRMNDEHNHRPEMVVCMDSIGVEGDKYNVGPAGIAVLGLVVESGIRVRTIPIITHPATIDYSRMHEDARDLTRDIRSLFAVPGSSGFSLSSGVRKVTTSQLASDYYQPQLLSGVQHSQSVRSVVVNGVPELTNINDRGEYWRCVAFALFSPYATHKIDTLELRPAGMRMRDVTSVQEVLSVRNPFAVIGTCVNPNTPPLRVRATDFYIGENPFHPDFPQPVLRLTFFWSMERSTIVAGFGRNCPVVDQRGSRVTTSTHSAKQMTPHSGIFEGFERSSLTACQESPLVRLLPFFGSLVVASGVSKFMAPHTTRWITTIGSARYSLNAPT